jgi:hypothetical protein
VSKIALLHEYDQSTVVERLVRIIEGAGHTVKLLEHQPKIGETIAKQIIDVIKESDAAIIVVSKGTPNIYYEIGVVFPLDKPLLLLVSNQLSVPSDLFGIGHLRYDSRSLSESFDFKVRENLSNVLLRHKTRLDHVSSLRLRNELHHPLDELSKIAEEGMPNRALEFERWLFKLVSQISDWEIVQNSQRGRDIYFDLAVWNNIDDSILAALGNPIVFEAKAYADAARIEETIRYAEKIGVKGFVFVTLSSVPPQQKERLVASYRDKRIIPILLDIHDLRVITSPFDLIDKIRSKASAMLSSGTAGV